MFNWAFCYDHGGAQFEVWGLKRAKVMDLKSFTCAPLNKYTYTTQQRHNTNAQWSGAHHMDPTPLCIGVVSLLCSDGPHSIVH
jgi:hypothetical protein